MSCPCRCHAYGPGSHITCDHGPEQPGGNLSCTPVCDLATIGTATDLEPPPLIPATPRDLWAAVDRLTRPITRRLTRDNGATERHQLPSLLDQLIEAVESGAGSKTGRMQESKPPLDASALSLLIEIAGTVRDACRQRRIKRSFDTELDLRQLASAVNTEGHPDRIDQCVRITLGWCTRIIATISSDPDRTWRMHGAACRVCSSTTVPVFADDGTESRQPAMIVHSDDGRIDRITCGFCGSTLTGADLTAIVADTRRQIDRVKSA